MEHTKSTENIWREGINLVREYLRTHARIYRLKATLFAARSAGQLAWVFFMMFMVFLIIIFGSLTLGFWLSSLTGSYIAGFGITSGILVLLLFMVALFRKSVFINPLIRKILRVSETKDPTILN